MRSPGIEPGSITWQATIITTRPRALFIPTHCQCQGDWSNGMILASGARGREFDSRITPRLPFFFFSSSSSQKNTRGGIRTRGLLLRRETRYPLRYTDIYTKQIVNARCVCTQQRKKKKKKKKKKNKGGGRNPQQKNKKTKKIISFLKKKFSFFFFFHFFLFYVCEFTEIQT